ncbi:MAG: beta-N-acetylhexosaminidase [Treponema sp.]|nr:beta-N-acetylhexosaminidase [Treponema sp.]
MKKHSLLIILILLLATSCVLTGKKEKGFIQPEVKPAYNLKELPLRHKVGQLFVIRPEYLDTTLTPQQIYEGQIAGSRQITSAMQDFYNQYPAGGIVLFYRNIENPQQLTAFTDAIHSLGSNYPLVCIDEEGGRVARIANNDAFDVPKYESMQVIGDTANQELALECGLSIGTYLRRYGIDVDFAPVADVNTNPDNTVIGDRAFSSDPVIAGNLCSAFLQGLEQRGVQGCLKHFPGHGDTKTDSHLGYVELDKTLEQLGKAELLPFKIGIQNGADMIMSAHIAVPKVTGSKEPSSLSDVMLTQILREQLGFNGIIITDALEMRAVSNEYDSAAACIKALEAGADILLMPFDYVQAFEGVLAAVQDGRISEERIDQSLERIEALKNKIHYYVAGSDRNIIY